MTTLMTFGLLLLISVVAALAVWIVQKVAEKHWALTIRTEKSAAPDGHPEAAQVGK